LTAQNGSAPISNGGARETEIEKSDILLAIIGEDAKRTFDAHKANLDTLKAQLKEGESERVQQLKAEVEELNSERQMIAGRIAELKQSIEKLEIYDAELCAKVVDMDTEVETECMTNSEEASRLNEEVTEASKAVKYGNSVGSLVDMLKTYDDALDKAINGSVQASIEVGDVGEGASNKMDMFLFRARNYFVSESQCVDFLRGRILASQKEVGELVSSTIWLDVLLYKYGMYLIENILPCRKLKLLNLKVSAWLQLLGRWRKH
jgi:chromosome segregation ATPase